MYVELLILLLQAPAQTSPPGNSSFKTLLNRLVVSTDSDWVDLSTNKTIQLLLQDLSLQLNIPGINIMINHLRWLLRLMIYPYLDPFERFLTHDGPV